MPNLPCGLKVRGIHRLACEMWIWFLFSHQGNIEQVARCLLIFSMPELLRDDLLHYTEPRPRHVE
jgi:hypothetical protein